MEGTQSEYQCFYHEQKLCDAQNGTMARWIILSSCKRYDEASSKKLRNFFTTRETDRGEFLKTITGTFTRTAVEFRMNEGIQKSNSYQMVDPILG